MLRSRPEMFASGQGVLVTSEEVRVAGSAEMFGRI